MARRKPLDLPHLEWGNMVMNPKPSNRSCGTALPTVILVCLLAAQDAELLKQAKRKRYTQLPIDGHRPCAFGML